MIYAYARVSSKEQNLDRQLEEFKKFDIDKIYAEKQSGKDFNSRKVYQQLKKKLKNGDTLIILSIDRLGRNYEQILNEWRDLTEKKKVDIQVIDMPVLNTKNQVEGLDGRFISNLVLQILAYVSQKERDKIKERQEQGIKVAKEKGVRFGRPRVVLPENTLEVIDMYLKREITNTQACETLGISRGTFFRLLKDDEKHITREYIRKPKIIKYYVAETINGDIIECKYLTELSEKAGYSTPTIRAFIKGEKNSMAKDFKKVEIRLNSEDI